VLVENDAMLKLADALGFQRSHVPGDHGLVRIELALRRPEATLPPRAAVAPDGDIRPTPATTADG